MLAPAPGTAHMFDHVPWPQGARSRGSPPRLISQAQTYPSQDVREHVTGYSCDYRLPLSTLRAEYPQHDFSRVQSDDDPYAATKEDYAQLVTRVRRVIDAIFVSETAQGTLCHHHPLHTRFDAKMQSSRSLPTAIG